MSNQPGVARALGLLLLLAGTCSCESGNSHRSATGVVPWVDRPLRLYALPQPAMVRYPTSAPLCHANQLRVSQGRRGAGLGNDLEEFVFENAGGQTCLLRGYPTIRATSPAGHRVTLRPQRGGTYFGQLLAADVSPGGHVFLDLATSSPCAGGIRPTVRYRNSRFSLPLGGTIVGTRLSIAEQCGLSMSAFGLPEHVVTPRARPRTPGTLQARLDVRRDTHAGAVLVYSVTLANPTAKSVSLRPCPGYTEGLYAVGLVVRRSFSLDCDSVKEISPRGTVRYEMRLAVPKTAKPGGVKLAWQLDTPTGPFAGSELAVSK